MFKKTAVQDNYTKGFTRSQFHIQGEIVNIYERGAFPLPVQVNIVRCNDG